MLGGHMEGGRRLEPGRAPRPPASPERPEPPRGPHAVLESKVKALKEKRGAGRPGAPTTTSSAPPERPSPKKPRPRRGKPGMDAAVAEPRAQLRTYLTDGLLDAGEPPEPPHGTQGTRRVPGGSQQHPKEGSRGGAPPAADGGGAVAGWEPLSLAERVERNRRLLQEVLGLAAAGSAHEVLASDGDWDSGVSLQDAEGCRAFVPGQELELSPRHEQAKQLLQRARMKARTNPLRASHDLLLLPAAPRPSREPGGTPRPSFAPREGEGPAGGSLSDSSSGESSCGPRRPRGPSPSRVRFEDESARDAEVRYLERLRHRRPLGSALERAGSEARGQPGDGAGPAKARGGDVPTGGKCRACGSLLGAAEPAESSPVARGRERGGQGAAQAEPKSRPLGPGGSPLWILPSRQRIHTEKIKETYIGDVRRADEADSALESTDTSDSCRTDSEEVGPRSPHPRAHRDPRARGHRAPRAPAQKEARAGKGASVASSPRAGAVGSGALCPPLSGSRDGGDPNEAPGSGEPPAPSSQPAGGSRVPAPPVTGATSTKKACSQVPCRKNLTSSRRCPEPDAGGASPKPEGAGQRRGPCGPIWLPGSPLRALSTNNCNNTRGQDSPGTGGGAPPQPGSEPSGDAAGTPRAQQDGSTAPGEPARVVSRKGSGASASSGLKKLLSSLSQSTKQRLGRFRCYSMEQLPAPSSSPGVKKSPSLQSLVSPFCQPRKATSAQSLHALLGKAPRASAYLLPQPGPRDRTGASGPRRSLSVEDIGTPDLPRTVGRVVEVFPDGTSQLELQRPPHGSFGFRLTSGHGRPDTGVYVQEMSDAGTAKLYAGLLGVGDEILQVNGAAVSGLGLARIRELLLRADSLSLRVLRQRPARR
ncbi:uncharacterized protein KIAA1614 homolog isoform X1 [Anser cygnoides]|uniref:uncharacterized protein KIAA1614 homolog isoform X1 n=2 Tax=Anser cygnoides TaxID=8845 RepID=UPI0034D32EF8